MHPNKIRALLVERGIKQAQIVRQLGIKPASVCRVIKGEMNSHRIREAIAQAVDKPISELWAA